MAATETDLGPIASMLQHMKDAVIVTTADLEAPGPTIVFVNRSFSRLTGYAPTDVIGQTPRVLQYSIEKDDHSPRIQVALKKRKRYYGDVINRRKDGIRYAAQCQIIPYSDKCGNIIYWINIQRNSNAEIYELNNLNIQKKASRSIFKNIPDLVCQIMADTTLICVNSSFEKFFGCDPKSLSRKRFIEFFPEKDQRDFMSQLTGLTPEQPSGRHEYPLRRRDGIPRWFRWRSTASFDAQGQLLSFLLFGTDVTEQRYAQQAATDSNSHRKAILDNIPDVAWLKDSESRFIAVNEPFATACGIPASSIVGKTDLDIWPEALARSYRADDREVLRTCKRKTVEERLVDHAGNAKWIETIKTPIFNERNEAIGTTGIARDITRRKTMEAALRESESRIRAITDALPSRIAYIDSDMRYRFNNKAYEKFFGVSPTDLYGQHLMDVLGENKYREISAYVDDVLRGNYVRYEYSDFYKGNMSYFDVIYVPDFGDCGEVKGFYALVSDITERKRAEEALFEEKERAQVTLHSIGDAVITTNADGVVEYLNPVAETLTGWKIHEAKGLALERVFHIIDEQDREPAPYPLDRCLSEGKIVGVAEQSILVDRKGTEFAIADTAAPIRGRDGELLGAVLVFRDVSATRSMARRLAHDAAHDPLTGLINRREFEKRLQRAVLSAKQHGSRHALCYLDLDQFKLLNDSAGHAAGDELLKGIRGLLAGKFRERDTLGRLGGDEFGLLLDNCALEEAHGICDIIVATLRDYKFKWGERTFQIGVSIGLVPVTANAVSAEQLLAQADVACYSAKESGRNQIHLYQTDGTSLSRRHKEIMVVSGIQDAIEQNKFHLYCQPIVDLSSINGRCVHYEILLRLFDTGEVLLPKAFIPAAERYGLMPDIDRWVIHQVLKRYDVIFGNESHIEISINISGNSLDDNGFIDFVTEQFIKYRISPCLVCFEITETTAIKNFSVAIDVFNKIKRLGSKLAIDDFGVGLSSFTYLKNIPADYLKIDGSFVYNMADSSVDKAMVDVINQVGHTLGMTTIAEWVQSETLIDRLRDLGVDWAQGNALGAPMPLDEVTTWANY